MGLEGEDEVGRQRIPAAGGMFLLRAILLDRPW
jgi:hypothetical protein